MPGPVVYVAVAITAVAAVIVFKEFVYDPHFGPKFSSWRESRKRQKAKPHQHNASSSSPFPSEGDGGPSSSPHRGAQGKKKQPKRSVEPKDTPYIDLQDLISSESLKSGIEANGDNAGIRQRRVGESQKPDRPVGNSADISGSNPTRPLTSIDDSKTSGEIPAVKPENRPSERVVASSPTPVTTGTQPSTSIQAVLQSDAPRSDGTRHPLDVRESIASQTPVLVEISHMTEITAIIEPGNFLTPIPMASGDPENNRSSVPDTGLFSPYILPSDQHFIPHDQTLSPHGIHGTISPTLSSNLSIEFLSSPSFSPPGSPFVDGGLYQYHEPMESHMGAFAQLGEISSGGVRSSSPGDAEDTRTGTTRLPPVGGSEIFSLSSQAPSDIGSDEGDYDSVSILESEISSWTSDVADREEAV